MTKDEQCAELDETFLTCIDMYYVYVEVEYSARSRKHKHRTRRNILSELKSPQMPQNNKKEHMERQAARTAKLFSRGQLIHHSAPWVDLRCCGAATLPICYHSGMVLRRRKANHYPSLVEDSSGMHIKVGSVSGQT